MKLKEFLENFEGMDPEAEVYFQMSDGCCGDTFELEDPWIDTIMDTHKKGPDGKWAWVKAEGSEQSARIIIPAMKFFTSCIRSGRMKNFYDSLYDKDGMPRKPTASE